MIYFILFDQTPKVKLARLGALCCIAFFVGWIFVSVARTAEPTAPRLAQIQGERAFLKLQVQNANLTFENALLKLEKLEKEEAEIKAKTAATQTEEKKGEEK